MSDRGKVQILMMNAALDYCKYYDGSTSTFTTLDSQVDKLPIVTAENQNMLVNTTDHLYIGKDNAFYGFGLCLNTFGDYGAGLWFQYYNDTDSDAAGGGMGTPGWMTFVPRYDSTESFSAHGVVMWGELENFAASTVDGQEAFWIRCQTTSVTAVAKFYNLLRNVTIYEPFKLESRTLDGGLHDDIQGTIRKTDITNFDIRGFLTLTDLDVMSLGQEGLYQLKSWQRQRDKLWIVDLARTNPIDFSIDAFIRNYVGYLERMDGAIESPYKEKFPYALQFKFESIILSTTALQTETFDKPEGGGAYSWVRDTTGTDADSDGGDNFHVG